MGKERLNDLDGKTWARYSISIWNTRKTSEEVKLRHPAMFPMELCERIVEIYTKVGDVVLDPFMGSGSTLLAAKKLGRKGVGIDIVEDYVKLAKERLSKQKISIPLRSARLTTFLEGKVDESKMIRPKIGELDTEPEVYCEDARNLLNLIKPGSVDLVVTSPPYWMIHKRKRTADYKEIRPYSELKRDLGNIFDYSQFMDGLKEIFEKVRHTLKPNKRCIIVVMDIRIKSDFIPFHIDIISMMRDLKFVLEDIIIWDRHAEYSSLRPLGYPYVFIVNKVHEYLMIFRKAI